MQDTGLPEHNIFHYLLGKISAVIYMQKKLIDQTFSGFAQQSQTASIFSMELCVSAGKSLLALVPVIANHNSLFLWQIIQVQVPGKLRWTHTEFLD